MRHTICRSASHLGRHPIYLMYGLLYNTAQPQVLIGAQHYQNVICLENKNTVSTSNLSRLRDMVNVQHRFTLPKTLAEFLVTDLPTSELQRERNFIIENFEALKRTYVSQVQNYINTFCDIGLLLNDGMFYLWLQGKVPTMEDVWAAQKEGVAVKNQMLMELADRSIFDGRCISGNEYACVSDNHYASGDDGEDSNAYSDYSDDQSSDYYMSDSFLAKCGLV